MGEGKGSSLIKNTWTAFKMIVSNGQLYSINYIIDCQNVYFVGQFKISFSNIEIKNGHQIISSLLNFFQIFTLCKNLSVRVVFTSICHSIHIEAVLTLARHSIQKPLPQRQYPNRETLTPTPTPTQPMQRTVHILMECIFLIFCILTYRWCCTRWRSKQRNKNFVYCNLQSSATERPQHFKTWTNIWQSTWQNTFKWQK